MKKQLSILVILLNLSLINAAFGQIDVNLVDIKKDKLVSFSDLYSTYNLDRTVPTMVITWSGKWCDPCINLINRYNQCDLKMLNLITVNVDKTEDLKSVIKAGHHLKWEKSLNFHANIGNDGKGFDNVFSIASAPLVLYLEDGNIKDAVKNYSLYPYKLITAERINDIEFIWNSSRDLNSLAWNYYNNESSEARLEEAIRWITRSIKLNKNYDNLDTYAALLFKTGEYTSALKNAKQAIEIAKENKQDYTSTTNLINKIIEKL